MKIYQNKWVDIDTFFKYYWAYCALEKEFRRVQEKFALREEQRE